MSKIILFTGGARSGKSTRAEQYASGLSNTVVYIATAEARDDEMRHRINRHQQRRPLDWRTLEAPLSVAASLAALEQGTVVLLDCLSLLVSNLLLAHEADPEPAIHHEIESLLTTGRERDLTLVIVTNEVGMGIVPAYPLGRVYRDLLGWSNQRVARAAREVYMVICGIPVELKELEATMGAKVTHGALDHAELAEHGLCPEALLDFSSNLNPFGPPPGVRIALAALNPAPYPDRSCLRLREELAARHGCTPAHVLPGNGSNELIHLIARALLRAGDTTLVIAPTFGEYEHACQLTGAKIIEWCASSVDGFVVDCTAIVQQIHEQRPRLIWLCAPNNPTGADVARDDLIKLAEACTTYNGVLVVDRTYHAFVRGCERATDQFNELPSNILLLHSLTKSYALAGLRLGYLLGNANLLARVATYQPTWSVSSAAQAAGLSALSDTDFLTNTLPLLWKASDTLCDGLSLMGLSVWRGALPFVLVRTGDGAATRAALLERGCVVRDCASFGLPQWVRVAPRRREENTVLLEAWKETL